MKHTFQSEKIQDIIQAMVQFQIKFQEVKLSKDKKNAHLKNEYVSFDNLLNVCRPILSSCNLVVVQSLAGDYLNTTIFHVSGQFIGADMPFSPMSGSKATNSLQDMGGGITYAKRYQFSAMLGISVDVDDDGQSSTNIVTQANLKTKKAVNDEQFNSLILWIQDCPEAEKKGRIKKCLESYELNQEQKNTIESL